MPKKILFFLVLVLVLAGCSKGELLENFSGPVDPENQETILVTVPAGTGSEGIADLLYEKELIQNRLVFKEMAKDTGYDRKFQAGDYALSPSMDLKTIIEKIGTGDVVAARTTSFTIPEGFELVQIIDKMVAAGYGSQEEIMAVITNGEFSYRFMDQVDRTHLLEGFLFPETYTFKEGVTPYEVVDRMLSQFDKVFKDAYYERLTELNLDLHQVITLASIIEREARLDEERALISSVFHNRLAQDMLLESCATVQYVLGERKPVLTYEDIAIESDYNTYKYPGLPPGPIASPGEKSIIAALYPATTDYLFFVVKDEALGSHYFNETYSGHLEDKNRN